MKKLIFLLSLFCFPLLSFAEEWQGITLPEETHYNISYFGMQAGYSALRVEKINFAGRKAIQLTARVKSSKMFSLVYKVDDAMVSIIDEKTLEPLWHFVDYHEGSYERKVIYLFDYAKGECLSSEGIVKIKKGILEPLGALLFLRINELIKIRPVQREIFDGREVKKVKAVLKKEKMIKTNFGRQETLVVKPILKDFRKEGITKVREKVTIYFQKELPKVPYLVTGKLLIGSLKAKLTKIKYS